MDKHAISLHRHAKNDDFQIDFAIFTKALRTNPRTNGQAIYMHRHAKNNDFPIDFAIFTKALRTDRRTDGPTDRRTDGRTKPLIEMR